MIVDDDMTPKAAATQTDIVIIGAGAAGMMCAMTAGARGLRVLVIDHAKMPGEKIRISGGGRCNFTHLDSGPANFLSDNPHFAKSALKRYTPRDFLALVERHGIGWHEKTPGQLFCNNSANDIITMLRNEMASVGVTLWLETAVHAVARDEAGFSLQSTQRTVHARKLVVASGGKSIPKMGATGLGYDIARQFGLSVTETRPALVPFTWPADRKDGWSDLSGVGVERARVAAGGATFDDGLLLTHRGISGPAALQVSSYWREGEAVKINFAPHADCGRWLRDMRQVQPRSRMSTVLAELLPKRLATQLSAGLVQVANRPLAELSNADLDRIADTVERHSLVPGGTEGYRTAEVTLGGVDTEALSQKTFEARAVPGLHFIGEVVDVTGHLGGHNFQWAWASGHAAGSHL